MDTLSRAGDGSGRQDSQGFLKPSSSAEPTCWSAEGSPDHRLCLRIGGLVCAMESKEPDLQIGVAGTLRGFCTADEPPDVNVQVGWGDLSTFVPPPVSIFKSGSLWQQFKEGDSYLFTLASPVYGPAPYKTARFSDDFLFSEVVFHRPFFAESKHCLYPLEYPLDELLWVNLLALGRGLEVHGCGVVDAAGEGHLFLGQSGAGKTTMAWLWQDQPGATILSDDRIILRKRGERLWMFGTPWHGEGAFASPTSHSLSHIYFLEKGVGNRATEVDPSRASGRLFACCFPVFHSPQRLDFTLSFIDGIVHSVPCFELHFVPEKPVVEFVGGLHTTLSFPHAFGGNPWV